MVEDAEAEGVDEDVLAAGIEGPGSSTGSEAPVGFDAVLAADEEDEAAPFETEGG